MELELNLLDWNVSEVEHELELEDMKRTTVNETHHSELSTISLTTWTRNPILNGGFFLLYQQGVPISKGRASHELQSTLIFDAYCYTSTYAP
mgnify:CR=1 FL=1